MATPKHSPRELLIEPDPRATPDGWGVTTHARYPGNRFTVAEEHTFPTPEDAKQWSRQHILQGARWVRWDFITVPDIPDIRAHRTTEGLWIAVDGRTIVSGEASPRRIKAAILAHPRAAELAVRRCAACGGLPRLSLADGWLTHLGDCGVRIGIHHPRIPMGLKIHAWNHFFSQRQHPLELDPVTLPHLTELGFIRDPSEEEVEARIRKVEVL